MLMMGASEKLGPKPLALWCGAAAAVSALIALYLFNPTQFGFYPQCLLYKATGLHCPGCGSLRAMHALLHGHVKAAFGLNPLAVLLAPAGLCGWIIQRRKDKNWSTSQIPAAWIWLLLATLITYGILRNIPAWPFNLLAP